LVRGLDLSGTQVTDAGLKELKELKRLQTLDLSSTKVIDARLKELKQLKRLQTLNLFNTQVTYIGINDLLESLPIIRGNYGLPPVPSDRKPFLDGIRPGEVDGK
jgi:Leucine Rich Repeat (LRR) protein